MKRLKSKKGTPSLPSPRQYSDPTRQGSKRKRAIIKSTAIFRKISAGISDIIKSIPVSEKGLVVNSAHAKMINNNKDFVANVDYFFDVNPSIMRDINAMFRRLIENNLFEGTINDESLRNFWFDEYVRSAYLEGANDAIRSAQSMAGATGAAELINGVARVAGSVAFDTGLLNRVNLVASRSFELMKGLSDTMRADLASTLSAGMADGKGVTELVRDVRKRVGVGAGRATRIVRTEINGAYRQSTRRETDVLNDDVFDGSGYKMKMLWFSALAPTTRKSHAKKHGRALTTAEVDKFYGKNANSINCYCSQSNVLVDTKTGKVVQADLLKQMREQRKEWFDDDGDVSVAA